MSRMSTPSHRCPCPQVVIAGASPPNPTSFRPSDPPKLKAKWRLSHQSLVSQAGIACSLEEHHLIDIDVAGTQEPLLPTSSWLSAEQWASRNVMFQRLHCSLTVSPTWHSCGSQQGFGLERALRTPYSPKIMIAKEVREAGTSWAGISEITFCIFQDS